MLYESTLVSDKSEFDNMVAQGKIGFVPAPAPSILTFVNTGDALLDRGAKIFFRPPGPPPADGVAGVGCLFCHTRATFSENAVTEGTPFTPFLAPVTDINNILDIRDLGFANIGLRPTFSDPFVGGVDPYGNPLSYGRQYKRGHVIDLALQKAIAAPGQIQANIVDGTVKKLETDGAAKIPTLRNVALTPPYFSWGGYSNLRQVMEVYNRGMSRRDIVGPAYKDRNFGTTCTSGDNSGSGPLGDSDYPMTGVTDCNTNTTGLIQPLGLSDCNAPAGTAPGDACIAKGHTTATDDLASLVRLMKSLTDFRVQCDQAPFDHPSLFVFNGHLPADVNRDGKADDIIFELPEIGNAGYATSSGFCIPNAGDLFAPGMQSKSGGTRVPLQ